MPKKFIFFVLFCILIFTSAYSNDYWDYPVYLVKNTEGKYFSNPRVVSLKDNYYIFYLEKSGVKYTIKYFVSSDLVSFKGPFDSNAVIYGNSGFIPQYNVNNHNGILYLIWNNYDGSLNISIKYPDNSWSKPKIIKTGKDLCFNPKIYILNNRVFITYHSESEGRRIDFFIINSDLNLVDFGNPIRISKEFAGSFFPYISYYNGKYYCLWQSRPFVEKETPVFDIYLSTSSDGINWNTAKNLTADLPGEKKFPIALFRNGNILLFYECDRDGTWAIYDRVYNLDGLPIGKDKKLNNSLANTIAHKLLLLNKNNKSSDNIYLFYMDERDGSYKIYYKSIDNNERDHQLKTGKSPILNYDVIGYHKERSHSYMYVFYQDKTGIAWIGPDKTVLPPKLLLPQNQLMGKNGTQIRWERPMDSSGLEGYCYLFTSNVKDEPEIVNLPPEIEKLQIVADKDGIFYFKIRSKDIAGNFSPVVSIKFVVDVTPPEVPSLVPIGINKNGYFKDNRVVFKWETKSKDIAGFNYKITKKPLNINDAKIKTKSNSIVFTNLKGGTWYFNIASIDKAGNISKTAHFRFKIKALPPTKVVKRKVKKEKHITTPWIITRETLKYAPIISILLYMVLGLLLFFVIISGYLLIKEIINRRIGKMEEVEAYIHIRKKKIGLRFKFSLLIVSLILVITLGISSILSYVATDKEKRHLAYQMIDKAKITLENIANVAKEGILNKDELLLVSVIAKTMENKDIKYTIILDNNNRIIAHSDITQKGKVLNDAFTIKASKADHIIVEPEFNPENLSKIYNFAAPVFFANKRIGTVRLGYSTGSIFRAIKESKKDTIYSTIIVTIITIIIGIISAVLMATITIRPIKTLAKGAYIIGSGNLNYKIHVKAKDEIGILADEFNRMTERLAQYQKEMEKKAKLDEQIEIARAIQQSLIPGGGIDNELVSIGGFYKAATGVGGDYYDFVTKNEKYSLIISDVAGKGVPASLMMTMIRTVFRSLINSGVIYPPRVVTLINNTLISDIASDRFATLLFGIYDPKKGIFQYTNAGYGPIMLYEKEKNECTLVEPKKSAIPIGVMPDVTYMEEKPIKLNQGDALILFTDGIHEARNKDEAEYGMDRLASIIPKVSTNDASQMANAIIEDVMNFVGDAEQYDDMTLLVLKVK